MKPTGKCQCDVQRGLKSFLQLPWQQMTGPPPPLSGLQQEKQSFHQPLTWRYPDPPAEEEPQYPPDFELKPPAAANSVSAVCGPSSVRVEAKKDLLGIGRPVLATDVTLGGCPATGEEPSSEVLVFESELHRCGSQLLVRAHDTGRVFSLCRSKVKLRALSSGPGEPGLGWHFVLLLYLMVRV